MPRIDVRQCPACGKVHKDQLAWSLADGQYQINCPHQRRRVNIPRDDDSAGAAVPSRPLVPRTPASVG